MGEHANLIAIQPEGTAGDLADGVDTSTARKPWTAAYMIRSTLTEDTELAGSPGGDAGVLS